MRWACITCVLFLGAVSSCDPVVKTANGEIRGRTLKSRNGRDYYSFTGIPYARPPVDGLRFKAPEPVDPWPGILDATSESDACPQNNHFFPAFRHVYEGQEDCLYLNVHTPDADKKLPVMVWIHGGGFVAGHGGPSLYGPDYFMDKDVVFVSFNYRLGLLGFVSTEDDVMPGNYGMKDQVMALRWVRENVAEFGGDPGRVTIFGESAGGASTGYHLLSPSSNGLFHKAILQSGTPMCRFATSTPGVARKRAEAVSTMAGCHADTSEDVLDCLKRLPATRLVELHNKFFEWLNHPCVPFPPVVEPCGKEAFICNHPITDFDQKTVVPTIVGMNSGEGGIFVASLFNVTSLQYPDMETDFNRLVASMLIYKSTSLPEHWDEIGDRIMKMYFPSGKINDHSHSNAVDMIGEGTFLTCVMDMVLKLSPPAYVYLFDYQNEFSFNKLYGQCEKPLGVSHGDEMLSLFPFKAIIPQGLNEKDEEVSKLMVDIWVKFASSKKPTVDGTDNGPAWPAFTSIEESSLLHIDSIHPKILKNPFQEKYKFWKELPLHSRLEKLTALRKSNIKSDL